MNHKIILLIKIQSKIIKTILDNMKNRNWKKYSWIVLFMGLFLVSCADNGSSSSSETDDDTDTVTITDSILTGTWNVLSLTTNSGTNPIKSGSIPQTMTFNSNHMVTTTYEDENIMSSWFALKSFITFNLEYNNDYYVTTCSAESYKNNRLILSCSQTSEKEGTTY